MGDKIVWTEEKVKRMLSVYGLKGFKDWLANNKLIKGKRVYVVTDNEELLSIEDYVKRLEAKAQ
jgi:hypothetical protein